MSNANKIHEAYRHGDMAALKALLGDPPDFPNCRGPAGMGENVLQYAIYWSPLEFVRDLLELGADPNFDVFDGFPSLIAALSTERQDVRELMALLLSHGANANQRGVNDYSPLHYAASNDDVRMTELLLSHGADPNAKTNVDDYISPLEAAERMGHTQSAAAMRRSLSTGSRP